MKDLELKQIIGFSGAVSNALKYHPDGRHIIYPVGSMVVIKNTENPKEQHLLQGHSNLVTCLNISKSGKYVVSGQLTHLGYLADVIIWDFYTHKQLHKMSLHKVKVQAVAFSPNDKFLVSLGGEDDRTVIVWDMAKSLPAYRAPATKVSSGLAKTLAFANTTDLIFCTAGDTTARVWRINEVDHKAYPTDCQPGQYKRDIKCLVVDRNDAFFYCGTTSGDVLQFDMQSHLFKNIGPAKEKDIFKIGVESLVICQEDETIMYVGAGDGVFATMKIPTMIVLKRIELEGAITSIVPKQKATLLAGTSLSNMYEIQVSSGEATLLTSCNYSSCNDICFPEMTSALFATASVKDIRIWNANDSTLLLKISIPNVECKCIVFKKDGTSLITGWTDGRIRAYGPQSGRLQYEIVDAHKSGVTALCATNVLEDGEHFKIISGGVDGNVRVWMVSKTIRKLENTMKVHKGVVSSLSLRKNDMECASSSADGSCIVWDLTKYTRNQIVYAPTFFKSIAYTPDESQLLTCGTDKKVGYWEAFDGSLIRELVISKSDSLNAIDITKNGKYFAVGGSDKVLKLYNYEDGEVVALGVGHSTEITKIKISGDDSVIASVSTDGAVLLWQNL